jgi:hypothetical protein
VPVVNVWGKPGMRTRWRTAGSDPRPELHWHHP